MRTGTLVRAAPHKVPVPKCSILNSYGFYSFKHLSYLTNITRVCLFFKMTFVIILMVSIQNGYDSGVHQINGATRWPISRAGCAAAGNRPGALSPLCLPSAFPLAGIGDPIVLPVQRISDFKSVGVNGNI